MQATVRQPARLPVNAERSNGRVKGLLDFPRFEWAGLQTASLLMNGGRGFAPWGTRQDDGCGRWLQFLVFGACQDGVNFVSQRMTGNRTRRKYRPVSELAR